MVELLMCCTGSSSGIEQAWEHAHHADTAWTDLIGNVLGCHGEPWPQPV